MEHSANPGPSYRPSSTRQRNLTAISGSGLFFTTSNSAYNLKTVECDGGLSTEHQQQTLIEYSNDCSSKTAEIIVKIFISFYYSWPKDFHDRGSYTFKKSQIHQSS
jgi:hypothetical protein